MRRRCARKYWFQAEGVAAMFSEMGKISRECIMLATVLSLGGSAAVAQTPGQRSPRSTVIATTSPARCRRDLQYYELSPETPETGERLLNCYKAVHKSEDAAAIFR